MTTKPILSINRLLGKIVCKCDLVESLSPEGNAYMTISRFGKNLGSVRVFRSDCLEKVVAMELRIAGAISSMVYAFAPKDSIAPHFFAETVQRGGLTACHLDLIPRTFSPDNSYSDAFWQPLLSKRDAILAQKEIDAVSVMPALHSLFSPAFLSVSTTSQSSVEDIAGAADLYLESWLSQICSSQEQVVLQSVEFRDILQGSDFMRRRKMFDPIYDPMWILIDLVIGFSKGKKIRRLMINSDA